MQKFSHDQTQNEKVSSSPELYDQVRIKIRFLHYV
jgi:hypothetical protein